MKAPQDVRPFIRGAVIRFLEGAPAAMRALEQHRKEIAQGTERIAPK
jgi:hypothetical protein